MRMGARLPAPTGGVVRVEIQLLASGAFLYLFAGEAATPRAGEEWYESLESAQEACQRRFGLEPEAWSRLDCGVPPARPGASNPGGLNHPLTLH